MRCVPSASGLVSFKSSSFRVLRVTVLRPFTPTPVANFSPNSTPAVALGSSTPPKLNTTCDFFSGATQALLSIWDAICFFEITTFSSWDSNSTRVLIRYTIQSCMLCPRRRLAKSQAARASSWRSTLSLGLMQDVPDHLKAMRPFFSLPPRRCLQLPLHLSPASTRSLIQLPNQ